MMTPPVTFDALSIAEKAPARQKARLSIPKLPVASAQKAAPFSVSSKTALLP
jgi:hypothetical protein